LALWAQIRVQAAFHEGQQYRSRHGMTGAEAAQAVLRASGIEAEIVPYEVGSEEAAGISGRVLILPTEGFLSDHYDPRHKVLRLSPSVFHGQSLSALGVAAHEAGHAVQDATRYPLLVIRNGIVPLANIGSSLAWIIFFVGLAFQSFGLVLTGIVAFSAVVLFQLINLPVEFDASRRARALLLNYGLVTEDEDSVVGKVLNAAALTYVAATLTAILTLLYFLLRAGLLGGRRED